MSTNAIPLVSVGIATYNRPSSLRKALDSVVNQTYSNLEILISEDCTPCDETKAVLREYEARDSRIKCFHQEKNLGAPHNIRFVLEQATGEYFMWADDDDVRDLRWVEALLTKFEEPNVSIAFGKVASIDAADGVVREFDSLEFKGARYIRLVRYFLTEERNGKANVVCGLFRTSFLRTIRHWSQYRHNKYGGGDYLFALDCIQHGNVVVESSVALFKQVPVYSEDFLRNGPGPVTKAFRQFRYLLDCVGVVNHPVDKLLLTTLIPVRLFWAAFFQVGQYRQRIAGRFKRMFGHYQRR
jgi:glycosyltransferase involved in cell wall biosynthesis